MGVAFPHELVGSLAGESRQGFRPEPSIGHKRRSTAVGLHAVQYFHHFSKPGLGFPALNTRGSCEGLSTEAQSAGDFRLSCAQFAGDEAGRKRLAAFINEFLKLHQCRLGSATGHSILLAYRPNRKSFYTQVHRNRCNGL